MAPEEFPGRLPGLVVISIPRMLDCSTIFGVNKCTVPIAYIPDIS